MGKDGICKTCWGKESERKERLKTILDVRAMVEHTWERFQITEGNQDAYEAVRNFDPASQSIYLYGDCGLGKSHLASLIIRQAVNRDLRSIIQTEPSPMLREINSALNNGAEAEDKAIKKFIGASLLVLDDLGTEKVTDYKIEKLYEVINGRDKAMKNGLVITSNYDLDALASRLKDDRIASRLSGMCIVKKLTGEDWRPKK